MPDASAGDAGASGPPGLVQRLVAHDDVVSVTAPAKLNLYLHITDRRPDGYHLLESVFVFTLNGDAVSAQAANRLSLDIDGPFAAELRALGGAGDGNLVIKAARALQAAAGLPEDKGAHITLTKNLPVAAGIGGGSSDAAAALLAMMRLWDIRLDADRLAGLALELGADVPGCLASQPCFIQGIGESVSLLDAGESVPVLLANPRRALATPDVFRRFAAANPIFTMAQRRPVIEPYDVLHHTHNDLAGAAGALMPELRDGFDALAATPGVQFVRLSGSGPTLFALYDTADSAESAAALMTDACPGWWTWADHAVLPATFDAVLAGES